MSPKAFSNCWHASVGNHISGTDESMRAKTGVDSKVVFPEAVVEVMERIVTTISRRLSGCMLKMTSFGVNLDAS